MRRAFLPVLSETRRKHYHSKVCNPPARTITMLATTNVDLARYIREIPDFPKPGILFRDITPLLAAPEAFREAVAKMAQPYRGGRIDLVVAAEARGFIFAGPLALELNVGLVPIRKPGKLPFEKHSFRYDLEYGQDTLE